MNLFNFEYIVQLRNEGHYSHAMNLLQNYIDFLEQHYSLTKIDSSIPEEILKNYAKAIGQKAILYRYLDNIEQAKYYTLKAIPYAEQSQELELLGLLISLWLYVVALR